MLPPKTIANYFPVEEQDVLKAFGSETRQTLDGTGVGEFVSAMDAFFGGLDMQAP